MLLLLTRALLADAWAQEMLLAPGVRCHFCAQAQVRTHARSSAGGAA
jgi:hypothetical protein